MGTLSNFNGVDNKDYREMKFKKQLSKNFDDIYKNYGY